jgi:hypothetical protein
MIPQLGLVLVALATVRAYRTLDAFLLAFGIAASVSVVVSGFLPALSPLVHYGIGPSDHPNITLAVPLEFEQHVQALRAGSMRMIDLSGAQGLVTFPSFHTATSVLLILAFWQVPYVRWPALALNGLLLLSVPIEGSHYLVDLIAGVFVALASWHFARRVLRTAEGPTPAFDDDPRLGQRVEDLTIQLLVAAEAAAISEAVTRPNVSTTRSRPPISRTRASYSAPTSCCRASA